MGSNEKGSFKNQHVIDRYPPIATVIGSMKIRVKPLSLFWIAYGNPNYNRPYNACILSNILMLACGTMIGIPNVTQSILFTWIKEMFLGSLWFNRVEETYLHKEARSSHALYFLFSHIYYWAIEKSIKSCDQVYSWGPRFNLGYGFLNISFLRDFQIIVDQNTMWGHMICI